MEVYIDDILVKSVEVGDQVSYPNQTFLILCQVRMILNSNNYTFKIWASEFLGFLVSELGIKVNPEKIQVVQDMKSNRRGKEV